HLMIRFFADAKYDFIGVRRYAYLVTGGLFLFGLIAMIVSGGLNYSIEFTGGTLVQVKSEVPFDVSKVRSAVEAQGISGPEIQSFGAPGAYVIRARTAKKGTDADNTQVTAQAVGAALDQALGKTVRLAVDEGFKHAMSAIVDSNVTTCMTALFLFQFGTGPVKGFAVTLTIGILASMVTAVFVTRTMYMIWLDRRPAMQTLSI
ncbi:MAG TPA: hypothetical protein VNH46_09590, partial [Gemmatimonadales bacterium]|nr:hypothetical protein [Gemmatimonadales bacterium]